MQKHILLRFRYLSVEKSECAIRVMAPIPSRPEHKGWRAAFFMQPVRNRYRRLIVVHLFKEVGETSTCYSDLNKEEREVEQGLLKIEKKRERYAEFADD